MIESNIIPFPGFKAMNLFGLILFVRKGAKMSSKDINHEEIHSVQWKELLYIGFLLWYCIEYVIRLFEFQSFKSAYKNISLEREAYDNQSNMMYICNKKIFSFLKYL